MVLRRSRAAVENTCLIVYVLFTLSNASNVTLLRDGMTIPHLALINFSHRRRRVYYETKRIYSDSNCVFKPMPPHTITKIERKVASSGRLS